jgi:FtsH-binding integral membrane protein
MEMRVDRRPGESNLAFARRRLYGVCVASLAVLLIGIAWLPFFPSLAHARQRGNAAGQWILCLAGLAVSVSARRYQRKVPSMGGRAGGGHLKSADMPLASGYRHCPR